MGERHSIFFDVLRSFGIAFKGVVRINNPI